MLIAKGYMELEETLMQWKGRHHLVQILEPQELNTLTLKDIDDATLIRLRNEEMARLLFRGAANH